MNNPGRLENIEDIMPPVYFRVLSAIAELSTPWKGYVTYIVEAGYPQPASTLPWVS